MNFPEWNERTVAFYNENRDKIRRGSIENVQITLRTVLAWTLGLNLAFGAVGMSMNAEEYEPITAAKSGYKPAD